MKTILILCINLLLFIISDADPLKLIAGDRKVIKKDGATHTISKYYAVPNDFDLNSVTNSTKETQKTIHSQHSKSLQNKKGQISEGQISGGHISEGHISEGQITGGHISEGHKSGGQISGGHISEGQISGGHISEGHISGDQISGVHISEDQISGGHISDGDISGSQISESQISEDRTTDNQSERKMDYNNNAGDFGIRIYQAHKADREKETSATESEDSVSTSRRLEADDLGNLKVKPVVNPSKIYYIKSAKESNVGNNISGGLQNGTSLIVENATLHSERSIKDEPNVTSLLSSLGTLVDENYARNIDSFWKLLRIYIDTTPDKDELLAKIDQLSVLLNIFTFLYKDAKLQKPTESKIDIIAELLKINLAEIEELFSRRGYRDESKTNVFEGYCDECLRKCKNNRSKPQLDSNGTYLSETGGREANNILAPEKPDLQRRHIYKLGGNRAETSYELDSNEVTVSIKQNPDVYDLLSVLATPTVNDDDNDFLEKSVLNQTRFSSRETIIDSTETRYDSTETSTKIDDLQTNIESSMADESKQPPWNIEDRTIDNLPWQVEEKINDDVTYDIDPRANDDLPWNSEDRKYIEYPSLKKIIQKPITFYQTKSGGKVLLHPNQPRVTKTVHTVDVQKMIEKPYQVYTYATKPETYEIQHIREVQSNLSPISGNAFNIPTSNSVIKVVDSNKPSVSYFKSQFGSLNQPTNPQLKYTKHVSTSYDLGKKINPSGIFFENTLVEPHNQHKHLLNTETYTSKSEQKAPQLVFPNVPINTHDLPISNEPVTISASTIADTSEEILDYSNQYENSNFYDDYYDSKINLNHLTNLQDLIPKVIKYKDYKEIEDGFNKPITVYEKQTKISNVNKHYPTYAGETDNYGEAKLVHGRETVPQPQFLGKVPSQEFLEVENDGNPPNPFSVYSGQTDTFVSKDPSEFRSDYNTYTTPDHVYTDQQTHTMPKVVHYPTYTKGVKEYDKLTPVYSGHPGVQNSFISKATSKYPNLASDNNASPGHTYEYQPQYPLISNVIDYPEYTGIQKKYDKTSTVHGEGEQSHYINNAESEYANVPSDYDTDYDVEAEVETDTASEEIIKSTNHLHVHRPAEINVNYSKLKLLPSYQLFTVNNLLKLHDAIIKVIEINGPSVYSDIALMNLKKIVNIILTVAEYLGETPGSNQWYEKIFYIGQNDQHPLHLYAYNLLRQRWLHELMELLQNNNFSFNILQNPGLFSFLGSWKFPKNVLHFLDAEELIEHDFYDPNGFDEGYTQNGLLNTFSKYDDVFADKPEDLENYLSHNVINAYTPPGDDIAVGVAGIDADPVANNIILMLQKYFLNKILIEKQENAIIRDNKVEMLKKVIWYLKSRGYDGLTIANLIRRLYTAVYSTEGKGCKPHHINFAKHMYDVIVPVLNRSGQ